MRIRVAFCDAKLTLASVRVIPSWFAWLLGDREFDDCAVYSSGIWHWDSTSRRVRSSRIVDAIERARKEQR